MAYVRVSITLPREVLAAADKLARAVDRPRSWLMTEALRQYLGHAPGPDARTTQPSGRAVHEPGPPPYGAIGHGLGESRLKQLEADLALTPEQCVVAAERTARVAEQARPRPKTQQVLQFDRYEDYLDWKRREDGR